MLPESWPTLPAVIPTSLSLTLLEAPYAEAARHSWDVIIHIGPLADSAVTQKVLAPNRRLLCAAPAYLAAHGTPAAVADLPRHVCGVIRENQDDVTLWTFTPPRGGTVTHRVSPAFISNDGDVIKRWALAGLGVIERSEWDVAAEIKAGRLVALLPDHALPDADIRALISPRTLRVARTRRFLDVLTEKLSRPQWRD